MNIQVCRDTSDAVALYLPQRLYLKSFAKLNISVQLPPHKVNGKALSNWELMEKLRKMILPDSFSILKVSKHNSEVIRYDAELEDRNKLERVIQRLEDRIVKLNDYPEPLKVRVSEAKSDFPSRHAWDSFFRDSTDMDEMKPGERPDTIHVCNLPIRWFVHDRDRDEDAPPSENIFKKVFEKFGSIRQVDVPAADPFRLQMKAAIRGITTPAPDSALYFEGYVQFSEYMGFIRCMDALRGCKLLRKKDDIAEWCGIRVDFDKSKHMTDAAVKRRAIVRERLLSRQKSKEEQEEMEKNRVNKQEAKERQKYERTEREKLEKMREREEKRKKKQLAKLMKREDVNVNSKVAEERKKLLKAQKKLQAIRLIAELFNRIELRPELQRSSSRDARRRVAGERAARARLVEQFKKHHEDALEEQRKRYDSALNGRIVIRSALEVKKPKRDSSISSASSAEGLSNEQKRIKSETLTTPEREMEYKKTTGMYGMHPAYGFGFPFGPCAPPHGYPYPQTSMYYPIRGAYYPPPEQFGPRRPHGFRPRGRGPYGGVRGRPRMPYYDGPDAAQQYYKYFKKLTETEHRNEHDDRARSRSRSRRRSYSRSRSRSRRRSYSRSRSRSRRSRRTRSRSRSRSRSRRTRSRTRSRSRSKERRSRSHHHSRSRSRKRSSSHSRRSKGEDKDRHTTTPREERNSVDSSKFVSPSKMRKERSKSWSLPKEAEPRKSWSKSPKEK